MRKRIKNIIAILISSVIITIAVVGCGSAKQDTATSENKANMQISEGKGGLSKSNDNAIKDEVKLDNNLNDDSGSALEGQGKIIRNGIIQMETLTFDKTVEYIINKTNSIGAYVQSSNVSGRSIEKNVYVESRRGEFILRIPKAKFDSFISDIGNLGSITNQQISTENVTTAYFDTQAHLKSLSIQEERLLELLKKTGELKDIIALEKELTDVRYEIESLTGNLKKWDNLIDFCTLNIQVYEVNEIKESPISFGEKIMTGFTSSVKSLIDFSKGFIVVISICLPYLVILSIMFLIIRYILIRVKRK